MENKGLFITVFADASFCHQTRSTGYAWWMKYGNEGETKIGRGMSKEPKNSTEAELLGLEQALLYIENFIDYNDKILILQCDNISAVEGVEVNLLGLRHVKRKHVKGHQGGGNARSWVNEFCDKEAKKQMRRLRGKNWQRLSKDD